MNNKKNLFVISSPLQLLNAIEARYYFHTSHNILFLLYNSQLNYIDYEQKMNLLKEENWDEIIFYDLGKITKKRRFFKQIELVRKLQQYEYEYIFIGDFGTIQQVIMANSKVDKLFLLDDGTATITIYDMLTDKNYFSKLSFSKKMKFFRYLLVNLKVKIKKTINFFTIYDIKPLPNIEIIKHDFFYLKQNRLKNCIKEDVVYILGQNLVDGRVGRLSEQVYLEYIQKIINKFKDKKIIYKPHRAEKITEEYKKLFCENFYIERDVSAGPIEVVLIKKQIYPAVFISFFSSALFSLDRIFEKAEIYSVVINPEDLIFKTQDSEIVHKCYDFLKSTNVKFLQLS